MKGHGDADGPKVVTLAHRGEARGAAPAPVPARSQPVAFSVEFPARGDIVFSIAALTQLITIADQAGVDAAGDLGHAIAALRRRLQVHDVTLPPALEEMIGHLDPGTGRADFHVLPRGRR